MTASLAPATVATCATPEAPAVLVTVERGEGSVPREAGAWMAVWADAVQGTIGGGQLEFEAIGQARQLLAHPAGAGGPTGGAGPLQTDGRAPHTQRYALGPSLGQCCGGVVHLRYEHATAHQVRQLQASRAVGHAPVALFGGGHVGRALAQALAPLPFALTWIDSRDEIFPPDVPPSIRCEHSAPVQAAVKDLAAGSHVLVMSFSHAEDLDVVAACLLRCRERADLRWIGLIGSRTKWATFRKRLAQRGFSEPELAQVTCPIGLPGISGKEPAVIAAAVAAQLLQLAGR